MIRVAALALLLNLAAPASAKEHYAYGPAPGWDRYKELGEAALRDRLPDAGDYTVEWPNGLMQGSWRHKGRFYGYLTCGRLRTLSPSDERRPVTNFVVVIDFDQVKTIDISTRESNSLVNMMCQNLVRNGYLPPVARVAVPQDLSVPSLGITIRSMPEGAYVVASAADGAGARGADPRHGDHPR